MCVVEGEVKEIGKKIVKKMMKEGGLVVLEIGKDVNIKKIVEKEKKEKMEEVEIRNIMKKKMEGMKE